MAEHPLAADECSHTYMTGDDTEVSCPLPVVAMLINLCPEHGVENIYLCEVHLEDEMRGL